MRRLLFLAIIVIAPIFIALSGRPNRSGFSAARPALHHAVGQVSSSISGLTTVTTDTVSIPTYPYQSKLFWITNTTYNISYPVLNWGQYGNPSPSPKDYTRLILENDYLRVTLLPELGGRIYELIDKSTGHDELYRNPVIKPTNWGPSDQGWWLAAGGIEWGLPVEEHGYESAVPWSYEIVSGTDGITITVRDSAQPDRLRASIGIFLPNDRAALIVHPKIENDRNIDLDYKWWINAMAAPGSGNSVGKNGSNPNNSDVRFIDPIDQVTIHSTGDDSLPGPNFPSGPTVAMSWPVFNNRDLSRLQNWNQWLGFFERPQALQDFTGVYDLANREGIVRIFPHSIATGAKGFGMGWLHPIDANQWTDDNSYYVEMHGGLAPTFWDSAHLNAHSSIEWTETWYPVAGLDDVSTATSDAALQVGQNGSALQVGLYSTQIRKNVHLDVWQRSTCNHIAGFYIDGIDPTAPQNFDISTSIPLDDLAILFHNGYRLLAGYNEKDCVAPFVTINPLPPVSISIDFPVRWSGIDLYSDIASYDVQYADGYYGPWTPWLTATTVTTATFSGVNGHTYFFRVRGRDTQGNVGSFDDNPFDAQFTSVLIDPAPVLELSYISAPKFVNAGSSINYDIALKNTGNLTGNVIMTDTLPVSMTLLSGTLTAWYGAPQFDGAHITWSGIVTPEAGNRITYDLTPTVNLPAGSVLINTIEIQGGVMPITRTAITINQYQVFLPIIQRNSAAP